MKEYIKIKTVFNRDTDGTKKLIFGSFRDETVECLDHYGWDWTEKIDGTNIRVHWDGHSVEFGGRTDKAQIPKRLIERLETLFGSNETEELFEQTFGEKEVILYGEGYGGKIQKVGHLYSESEDFILFDVYLPETDIWLKRDDVEDIAETFGIKAVPVIKDLSGCDIYEAIAFIKQQPMSYLSPKAPMEGIVGRPPVELKDRLGNRVITKIKAKDFEKEQEHERSRDI